MDYLISGGAGFIGSHLCTYLLNEGHSVTVADKLKMGDENIRDIESPGFHFYNIDLSDEELVQHLFSMNRFDCVFHMAANSDIQSGGNNPTIDFADTFITTRNVLEGMRSNGIKKIVFASTSAVYGEITDCELKEETGGLKPISYYGGAKLASEAFISSYANMCNLDATVFRFPNVIGPRLTHGVIYDFVRKLKENHDELVILGDGTQCKPYIYITDLINAIILCIKQSKGGYEVFNISTPGEGTTVTDIARIVVKEMGLTNVEFKYTGGDRGWNGDVPHYRYDITKVLSLGWSPQYSSDEAVRKAVRDILATV